MQIKKDKQENENKNDKSYQNVASPLDACGIFFLLLKATVCCWLRTIRVACSCIFYVRKLPFFLFFLCVLCRCCRRCCCCFGFFVLFCWLMFSRTHVFSLLLLFNLLFEQNSHRFLPPPTTVVVAVFRRRSCVALFSNVS